MVSNNIRPDRNDDDGDSPLYFLEQAIAHSWPVESWAETRLLLAVSGGADSVAMLRAFLRIAEDPSLIEVAHFNHGWRGEESDADERFVVSLCAEHQVRLSVTRADEVKGEPIPKTEEAARNARYEFLGAVASSLGARYVVTAHTQSDRVETVLHNMFRGTGLAGVRSLESFRHLGEELVLARPMLGVARDDVLEYLDFLGQSYREDSSNSDEAYRRNFLRQTVLPTIRSQYASADEKIVAFSEIVSEFEGMLSNLAADYLTQAEEQAREANRRGHLQQLDRSMFAFPHRHKLDCHWPIVRQALVFVWLDRGWPIGKMSRRHWLQLQEAFGSSGLNPTPSPGWQVECNLPGDLQLKSSDKWFVIQST